MVCGAVVLLGPHRAVGIHRGRRVRHLPPDRRQHRGREDVLDRFRQRQREERPGGAGRDNGSEPASARRVPAVLGTPMLRGGARTLRAPRAADDYGLMFWLTRNMLSGSYL